MIKYNKSIEKSKKLFLNRQKNKRSLRGIIKNLPFNLLVISYRRGQILNAIMSKNESKKYKGNRILMAFKILNESLWNIFININLK